MWPMAIALNYSVNNIYTLLLRVLNLAILAIGVIVTKISIRN